MDPTSKLRLTKPLRVGTWNVRTLCGLGAARILAAELERARVDIMGLQEVRWSGVGESSVADRTILWSGPPEGAARQAGVALVLSKKAAAALTNWQPVDDRLLVARFKHGLGSLTVIVAYAPTNDADDSVKDDFYHSLDQVAQRLGTAEVVLCLGDFNAVTGTSRDGYASVIGPHGSGTPNDNTERLLNFCVGAGFRVAGSWFERRNIHRYTWYSNDGMTAKKIDHILVNTRWKAVQNCRVYRSMEFNSDHRPVVATVAIKLRRSFPQKPATLPRYNVKALTDPAFQQLYAVEVSNRFSALSDEESTDWSCFKEAINDAAAASIGRASRGKNKDWIGSKSWDLIEKKREARLAGRTDEYRRLGRDCRAQLRVDRQCWADEKAEEGERALSCGQAKDAFAHFRRLRAATVAVASPILDANGALISNKQRKLQRWREHFDLLLNRPQAVPSDELQQAASEAVEDPDISCGAPTEEEIIAGLRKLKNGKAPGCCGIPPEMLKEG